MSIPVDQPELLKAQFRALSQQLPMMYLILMTSTWAVALTHMPYAPGWLTIAVPSIMTADQRVTDRAVGKSPPHRADGGQGTTRSQSDQPALGLHCARLHRPGR